MEKRMMEDMLNGTCPYEQEGSYRLFHYDLHCASMYVLARYESPSNPTIVNYTMVPEGAIYHLSPVKNAWEMRPTLDADGNQKYMEEA